MRSTVKNVRTNFHHFANSSFQLIPSLAHNDAIWDISWLPDDSAISISADGSIKQWDSTSGQVSRTLPPHTLGLVSLSTSPSGEQILFNSLEGLTSLWDLGSGEVVGKFESFVRTREGESVPGEPGVYVPGCA